MILKEKEKTVIQDLQTQEKSCIEKYGKYAQQARDPELKSLFQTLQKKEQEHYDSLSQVLSGTVPQVNCNDSDGRDYQPKAAYTSVMSSEDKEHDAFLATDCIGTEKLISGEYNSDVFAFEDSGVRKLLADIQVEEQNHAESLSMILSGSVPECNCNDRSGKDYQPKAVYTAMSSPEDKQHDAFLATDCIGTEKLVSGTYNDDVFAFGDSGVRKLLADIQIEEQNHAEMLYKYKTANGMF